MIITTASHVASGATDDGCKLRARMVIVHRGKLSRRVTGRAVIHNRYRDCRCDDFTVKPAHGHADKQRKSAVRGHVLPHVPHFDGQRNNRIVLDRIFATAHNVVIAVN
jgi:hypothetical protein